MIGLILYLFALWLVTDSSATVPNSFVTHYDCYCLLVIYFASHSLHLLLPFIYLFENDIDILWNIVG